MYTLIKTTTRLAVVIVGLLLTACVTDVYDPKPDPEPTPGGGDFDFSTVKETTLSVNVNDLYNGEFDYLVEVYYENPFSTKDAECKFKGVASDKKPLTLTLVLPQALEQIYVMQKDPTQGRSVQAIPVISTITTLNCDFRPHEVAETMSARAAFMTKGDQDMIELTGEGKISLEKKGKYIISAGKTVSCDNLILGKDIELTISGSLIVSGDISLTKDQDKNTIFVNSTGIVKATNFELGKVLLFNEGKITITGKLSTENSASIDNYCYMDMKEFIGSNGAGVILHASTLFKCKTLSVEGFSFKMYGNSILRAETATFGTANSKINGVGSDFALVDLGEVTLKGNGNGNGNVLHYDGNIKCIMNQMIGEGKFGLNNGAQQVDKNASIEIPAKGCSGEGNVIPDKPEPSNPDYPIDIPNGGDYTFAMEDNWPKLGDYDMNDLVLGMKITSEGNGDGITGMVMQINLRAVGATKKLGAGLQFENVSSYNISAVTNVQSVDEYFSPSNNGVESGDKAVLPLFDNAHGVLGVANGQITNTYKYDVAIKTLSYYIDFKNPVPQADLVITKLNFFIVNGGNSNQRSEVHLAGYAPTAKVKGNTPNYLSENGMVWGIMIPTKFLYPKEGVKITDAYEGFLDWSQSGGKSNADWYNSPTESGVLPIYEENNVGK